MAGTSSRRCGKCAGILSWNGKGYVCLNCGRFIPDAARPPSGPPKPPGGDKGTK